MSDKIITQKAKGYGSSPATVTVQIDGITVFQGAIPTQDIPPPALPDAWTSELGVDAWSWTVDETFDGTQTLTISVDNGDLYLFDTYFALANDLSTTGSLAVDREVGGFIIKDPFSAVTINGIAQNPTRDQDRLGQWVWQLHEGDEFACTVNVVPKVLPNLNPS